MSSFPFSVSGEEGTTGGPPLESFYETLGISRTATNDEIKRAYKKAALRFHPDKVGSSPEAVAKFQRILKANEVLMDEKNRKIYDKYGERGLDMIAQMGAYAPFIDPDVINSVNLIYLLLTFIVSLLIIFPAFISVRADGRVQWAWSVVFIPAFIFDGIILLLIVSIVYSTSRKYYKDGETMDDEQQHQQQQGIHQEDQDDQQREQAASKRKRLITLLLISSAVISYLLLFITFQIFIAIKLDSSVTSWSWAVVFIPWWILESAHLAISLKSFVFEIISGKMTVNTVYPNDNEDGDDENRESTVIRPLTAVEIIDLAYSKFGMWSFRVVQAIIFICQVDGVWGYPSSSSLSWAVVFIPTYLGGIIHLSILSSRYHFAKRQALSSLLAGGPTRGGDTNVALLQASICCFVVMGIMFYAGLALFITRMGNVTSDPTSTTPTAAVVMVPVFIVLSLLFCCVCCCLPCSTMGMRQSLEDELSEMSSAGRMYELVSYKKRITWQQQQQQQQLQQGGGGPSKVVQSTSMEPLVQ